MAEQTGQEPAGQEPKIPDGEGGTGGEGGAGKQPQTFSRRYVQDLRTEAAEARVAAREAQEALDKLKKELGDKDAASLAESGKFKELYEALKPEYDKLQERVKGLEPLEKRLKDIEDRRREELLKDFSEKEREVLGKLPVEDLEVMVEERKASGPGGSSPGVEGAKGGAGGGVDATKLVKADGTPDYMAISQLKQTDPAAYRKALDDIRARDAKAGR